MQLGSEQPDWWRERISEWSAMGYQMEELEENLKETPERASELIVLAEKSIAAAENLRNGIIKINERHAEQAVSWLHMLDDINNVEIVEEEFGRFNLRHRPWVIDAKSAIRRWEDRRMVDELEQLVTRLDSLDPVFIAKGSLLGELFQDPASLEELDEQISRLENSQQLRWNNLESMVIALHEKGVDADNIMQLDLSSAYEKISRLEVLAEKIAAISNDIAVGIAPFDLNRATSLENRLKNLDFDVEEEIISLSVEVNAVSTELDVRHLKIVNRLRDLTNAGFILPPEVSLDKKSLLQMEEMIDGLEKRALEHDELIGSASAVAELWPELNEVLHDVGGDLTRTEDLVLALANSEERIKDIRINAEEQISSWSELGFEMSRWRSRFDDLPVQAMSRWQNHLPILRSALELIRRLEDLDTSLIGKDEVEDFVSRLQAANIEEELFEEAEEFLHSKGIRNKRHRRLLQNDIKELVVKGQLVEFVMDENMSLKELEEVVHSATMGVGISSEASTKHTTRLPIKALQNELDSWQAMDWDVSGLNDLLESDPIALGRMIEAIREDMEGLNDLTRRLQRLPLKAAPQTRAEIIAMMRKPEALSTLHSRIPEFAAKAAKESEGVRGGADLWKPEAVKTGEIIASELDDMDVEVLHASIEEMYSFGFEDEEEFIEPEKETEREVEEVDSLVEDSAPDSVLKEEETEPSIIDEPEMILAQGSEEEEEVETYLTPETGKDVEIKIEEDTPSENIEEELKMVESEPVTVESDEEESEAKDDGGAVESTDDELAEILRVPLNRLLLGLGILGVKENLNSSELERIRFAVASKVGIKPRDSRVDRLLKLALRLIPREPGSDTRKRAGMILMLASSAEKLNEWSALRLRSRNAAVGDGLLENSWNLGKTLSRIPGPGFNIPLEPDKYQLPSADELNELAGEVARLNSLANLASSSGIKAL